MQRRSLNIGITCAPWAYELERAEDDAISRVLAGIRGRKNKVASPRENAYVAGMPLEQPLDQMTLPEKLQLMEALWDDLTRKRDDLPSPEWHGDVLAECDRRAQSGEETFSDWEAAKADIRRRVG